MPEQPPRQLQRYAWLSIAAALATMSLKTIAWALTDSVGLLSDAAESLVNLAGAVMVLWMLTLAARPADAKHPHGHGKAEYFSSAFEGLLIILAALGIGLAALDRFMHPQALNAIGPGLLISLFASAINGATALVLLRAGKRYHSITLEADGRHLMTDVWTSAGVIAALGLVWLTNWGWLDPAIAVLVAINIVWTGWGLIIRSTAGLMDISLPTAQLEQIENCLNSYAPHEITYHALRTRQAGSRSFISLHVLVPGHWSVQKSHDWAEKIEADLRSLIPYTHVTTHIEPREDQRAMDDQELDL